MMDGGKVKEREEAAMVGLVSTKQATTTSNRSKRATQPRQQQGRRMQMAARSVAFEAKSSFRNAKPRMRWSHSAMLCYALLCSAMLC